MGTTVLPTAVEAAWQAQAHSSQLGGFASLCTKLHKLPSHSWPSSNGRDVEKPNICVPPRPTDEGSCLVGDEDP